MSYLYLVSRDKGEVVVQPGKPLGLVPWGVAHGTQIVFARPGTPAPAIGSSFSKLDSNMNLRRRVEFESTLAAYVLMDWSSIKPAIAQVNSGLLDYMTKMSRTDKYGDLGGRICGFLFNYYFGRLGVPADAPKNMAEVVPRMMHILEHGTLQQVMNIHQIFSFFIMPHLGYGSSEETAIAEKLHAQLKPGHIFSGSRGRKYRRDDKSEGHPTAVVGYTAPTDRQVARFVEPHPRAVELYEREQMPREPDLFVAAASGSTGDLLKVALHFASGMQGESLKQYVLACVGFLVGGGHHTFHEVMQIARLGGLYYIDGQYDAVLPVSFKMTAWYKFLRDDYRDILFAGHIMASL